MTVLCNLPMNGYALSLQVLIDSGANGFAFIDQTTAVDWAKFLGIKAQQLPHPISGLGYNGQSGASISHILRLHLIIDGRRQLNLPFMITPLGSHQVILGLKWLDNFVISVDCSARRLSWPSEYHATTPWLQNETSISQSAIVPKRPVPSYQADIARRDKAILKDEKRREGGRVIITTIYLWIKIVKTF